MLIGERYITFLLGILLLLGNSKQLKQLLEDHPLVYSTPEKEHT
jgi:hypothetical protein